MHKLAVFVEGQTEQIFVKKLLQEIAGERNVRIRLEKATGGKNASKRIEVIEAERADRAARYYIQIVDCSGESRVASEIRDAYTSLSRSGFSSVIGLRDVFPLDRAAIPRIRRAMRYPRETTALPIVHVLAVMEIEAWFLAEHRHFTRIDAAITLDAVRAALRFDPSADDMELRDHPSADLADVYRLGGKAYRKKKSAVEATVGVLDYEHLYVGVSARMGNLAQLTAAIDGFLAAP